MASALMLYLSRTYQWNFSNKIQVPYMQINSSVSEKKSFIKKCHFTNRAPFLLTVDILLALSCSIFLTTFHASIFLNIKLEPTMTSSPRRRSYGLHNPDSSHDPIRCFWLAEVRNFTNIMIELLTSTSEWYGSIHLPEPHKKRASWNIMKTDLISGLEF